MQTMCLPYDCEKINVLEKYSNNDNKWNKLSTNLDTVYYLSEVMLMFKTDCNAISDTIWFASIALSVPI